MNEQDGPPSMNQEIFKMGLSTEAVSAYLLCCSLADDGKAVSTKNLLEIWNSAKAVLIESLKDLERKDILKRRVSDLKENIVYQLTDVHEWGIKDR